ncbi:MAG: hypothetical protein ABI352_10540 [Candidatus Dormibacter sp.]
MDPTGLLDAVLAVGVYPGALFLALASLIRRRVAGQGAGPRSPGVPPPLSLVPVLSAVVGTAMLPLTGSPALRLPPPVGATGNVVAIVVLLAVAADLGAGSRAAAWLAAAAALPVLGLAASLGTLNLAAITTAEGTAALAARTMAAAMLVMASSLVAGSRTAAVVAAALALAGASLVVPSALRSEPPVLGALACLGMVLISSILARPKDRWPRPLLTAAGTAACVAGVVLALLAARA